MATDLLPAPRLFQGVMISSTFTDLERHRALLTAAIKGNGLTDVSMENDVAKPGVDVIGSSLRMVEESTAYVAVLGHKHGQTPKCSKRNPNKLSITELEFNKAVELGLPILLFLMGEDHPVKKADVEPDAKKRKKLEAFRERAKEMGEDTKVHRIYSTFQSAEEFGRQAERAVADLRRFLDARPIPRTGTPPSPDSEARSRSRGAPIPIPPELYAEPRYLGSHDFTGRATELQTISDWASPDDPYPMLLFEAIGGTGKSMLTWHWVNEKAPAVRSDWAGRFWYSFYERGALMQDFCQHALAYMTGRPLEDFRKLKTAQMREELLHHVTARPWLIVLDGLERVLVAYHRIDAASLPDEQADTPTDQMLQRDPCSAIRPEDDDLLRALAGTAPSRILVTSRLVPRVLLNKASQPIPGVRRELLKGLRPEDAEVLFRSCNAQGDSATIRRYLQSNCDCHPLVTGALAGLVANFPPAMGDFDAWLTHPIGGGAFNFTDLDLTQRRNHILDAALAAIDPKARDLLATLALLSESADYALLEATNPHLPAGPEDPGDDWDPDWVTKEEHEAQHDAYKIAMDAWRKSPDVVAAPKRLAATVTSLQNLGLLQFDHATKHYDLHPVVRGVATGRLSHEDTENLGQRLVDYCTSQPHDHYEDAESIEELRNGILLVRTLVKMERLSDAYGAYWSLRPVLLYKLEAYSEALALLKPFFPQGWASLPDCLGSSNLATEAAIALLGLGKPSEARSCFGAALIADIQSGDRWRVCSRLRNFANLVERRSEGERLQRLALELSVASGDREDVFGSRLNLYLCASRRGDYQESGLLRRELDTMDRNRSLTADTLKQAELIFSEVQFWMGNLTEQQLTRAESPPAAHEVSSRQTTRYLLALRGEWRLERGEWKPAADSLHEAVRMAREVGILDARAETMLALARFHLEEFADPGNEVARLANQRKISHRWLAELWLALGNSAQAKDYALKAYEQAWADGEPYVHRYELTKAIELLERLKVPVPELPPYDPAKNEIFPWEEDVKAMIDDLKAKKQKSENE